MATKPHKTLLSVTEAKRKWGDKLHSPLPGGGSVMKEMVDDAGDIWKPEFDASMTLTGYRLWTPQRVKRRRRR